MRCDLKISYRITAAVAVLFLLFSFCACNKGSDAETADAARAEFSGRTKMFKSDGLSVIMDTRFVREDSDTCAIRCVNGDLTFEAFCFEKYYFTEKDDSIDSTADALAFVNKDREVKENSLGMPYVEYSMTDGQGTENTFYYVCIADDERYWFCTFFSRQDRFEDYRNYIYEYLSTVSATYESE